MLLDQVAAHKTRGWEDWPEVFDKHGVQFLALDRGEDRDLLQLFQSHPKWTVDLEDGGAVLFARTKGTSSERNRAGIHDSPRPAV